MKLIETIETFISGDWGNESHTEDTPCEVFCVRGADIEPIKTKIIIIYPKGIFQNVVMKISCYK